MGRRGRGEQGRVWLFGFGTGVQVRGRKVRGARGGGQNVGAEGWGQKGGNQTSPGEGGQLMILNPLFFPFPTLW